MPWRYYTLRSPVRPSGTEVPREIAVHRQLNQLGAEGWELVSSHAEAVTAGGPEHVVYLLKRELSGGTGSGDWDSLIQVIPEPQARVESASPLTGVALLESIDIEELANEERSLIDRISSSSVEASHALDDFALSEFQQIIETFVTQAVKAGSAREYEDSGSEVWFLGGFDSVKRDTFAQGWSRCDDGRSVNLYVTPEKALMVCELGVARRGIRSITPSSFLSRYLWEDRNSKLRHFDADFAELEITTHAAGSLRAIARGDDPLHPFTRRNA